jgi:hypothetical protein
MDSASDRLDLAPSAAEVARLSLQFRTEAMGVIAATQDPPAIPTLVKILETAARQDRARTPVAASMRRSGRPNRSCDANPGSATDAAPVIGVIAPTRRSDAARKGSDPAKRPAVQPEVALELRVPFVVVRGGVPVEPRLVGHGGSPLQERQGIRADRIP